MKRNYLLMMLIAILSIGILVACGGADQTNNNANDSNDAANNNANNENTDNNVENDESSSVETIKDGVLMFGSSGLYKPFNYEDLDGNQTGFEVDLGIAIAEEMGLEPEPVFTQDFGALLEEVNTDRIDVIMGSLTITDERAEVVDFSQPYYRSGPIFYVHKDNEDILTWDDLDGKQVGVVSDSVYEDTVLEYISEDQLNTYQSDTIALQDLAAGTDRLNMVLTDKIVGLVQMDENNLDIKAVGDLILIEEIGAAVRKGNDQLLNEINRALDVLIENGTYAELSNKWFGENILE